MLMVWMQGHQDGYWVPTGVGEDGCFDDLVVSPHLLRQYSPACAIRRSIAGQPGMIQCWRGELCFVERDLQVLQIILRKDWLVWLK